MCEICSKLIIKTPEIVNGFQVFSIFTKYFMLDAYQSSRCNCELSTLPILHQSFLVFCDSDVISYFEQSQQFYEKSDPIAATEWEILT